MNRTIPRIEIQARNEASDALGYLYGMFVDDGRIFAIGGHGGDSTILLSIDGGETFTSRPVPRTTGLRRMTRIGEHLVALGEYGTLALSDDVGLTWTPLPMPTEACLSRVVEDGEETRWVMGDDAFVARAPRGSWDFAPVETEAECRFLSATVVGGRVVLLGNDGNLWFHSGSTFEPKKVWKDSLNTMVATKSGALLITANKGGILRSEDGGKTFTEIPSYTEEHIEDAIVTDRGIFACGGSGVLLFSNDDGKSFVPVETGIEAGIWSFAATPTSVFFGADEGAVYELTVSATETIDVEIPEAAAAADDGERDEDDNDDESDGDDAQEQQENEGVQFASIEEASARWIKEGRAFMTALNAYVDRVYAVGVNKAGQEPSETREDMADYVRERLVELNAKGEHRRARELFPPAYEPFDYERLGEPIRQLARLADGKTLMMVNNTAFTLEKGKITELDAAFFALSADRRLVGLSDGEKMTIHEGLGGPVLRTLSMPAVRGENVMSAQLTPEGDGLLLVTDGSATWISDRGSRLLMPEDPDRDPHYIHAAMSPNGRFVAIGCQDSAHILIDRKTGERHNFGTVSSYPHFAAFHHDRPEAIFNSVHGLYGSGTLQVNLDALLTGKGEDVRVYDRRSWLHSAAPLGDGWLLGDRGGYVWCLDGAGKQKWYLFVGSSITAMNVSPDQKTLLLGSYAGYVIEIDLAASGRDPMLLTNGNVKETARWVFWRGHDPMIW
jgi:photosystem II stability/assembly factor-like uncharacterized protein